MGLPRAAIVGCNGNCEVGEGNCTYDSDCAGNLKCFKRPANAKRSVPGVYVEDLPENLNGMNLCYDPNYTKMNRMYAVDRGGSGCTS